MLIIGSHVSYGKEQLLGAAKEALEYEANTFMFYTGAPQNTIRKDIDDQKTKEAIKLMEENGIDINNVICHAPYIVNLAKKSDKEKYEFSKDFIKKELIRCDAMNITKMVLHPGNAVGITKEEGLKNIVDAINEILDGTTKCKILLETMAGKGTECGVNLEEMEYLIKNIKNNNQIGVCLDTCHLNDSGIDINNFDEYLKQFDTKIGLDKIGCIHVNDSKNEINTHKDRHANIGKGTIGFNSLLNVLYNEQLENIPKILETPYIGIEDEAKEKIFPPYKFEIEMIRNKKYNEHLYENIRTYYNK